ncbi:MAG TPA: thrombospondin type 3 repeat-containing protein, partial [Candidatus Paceibacterota bacterium]|nr:thrombospondin type 3 repeat-containing protein [Candidatus Paceibacterota bacterium]
QTPYILTGPVYRSAKGTGVLLTNAPPGQYVVTFGEVPYYITPPAQTNQLASGATVVFHGNYTFADANSNGISDAWEQTFFGSVSTNHTRFTDSDHDGASDYAEFIAGTDPTLASSRFRLNTVALPGNGTVRMTWSSVPGHAYRIYGSSNLVNWVPMSDWIQATLSSTSFTLTTPTNGAANLFRVEVRP